MPQFELNYPVKNKINDANLFGANPAYYLKALGQNGHPGIDFECPLGTPLYSPCDGAVFYTTDALGGDGLWIRWPDNVKPQYNIILWHMPAAGNPTYPFQVPTDKNVYPVKAGQFLGYTGNSGYPKESSGPHLHLGVIPCDSTGAALNPNNGYKGCVDPMPFFNGLYAEDINTVHQILDTEAQATNLIAQTPLTNQEKLSLLAKIKQSLIKLAAWFGFTE